MGLFDQFKQALTRGNIKRGFDGALHSAQDIASNPTNILQNHNVLQNYGREMQRIQQVGIRGSGVIRSVSPAGGSVSGNDWVDIEMDMTLPGREPYGPDPWNLNHYILRSLIHSGQLQTRINAL